MKTLILYAYNDRASLYDANLFFFLTHGVFESDHNDFCIIISGFSKKQINETTNLRVLHRENKKGDFGAWGDALKLYNLADYDRFIFINDTSRGPYVQGTCNIKMWPELFTSRLNDRCKLVGPTQNSVIANHIQSYAFACDSVALKILMDDGIFTPTFEYPVQKMEFIVRHEVGMSRLLVDKGYTFEAFFRGDGITPYFGSLILSPFEIMFVKANMPMRFDKRQMENATPGWNGEPMPNILFHSRPKVEVNQLVIKRSSLQRK